MPSSSLGCPGKAALFLMVFAFVAGYQGSLAETRALDWDTFVDLFVEDCFVAHPDFAVRAGRHEFDGKLPDWSPAALEKEAEHLGSNRKRALEFDPGKLDGQQRSERDYLIAVIDRDLVWLTSARWPCLIIP